MAPEITGLEITEFTVTFEDIGYDEDQKVKRMYQPGTDTDSTVSAIQVHTDTGVSGEYVGPSSSGLVQLEAVSDYVIGQNPFHRERIWTDLRRIYRQNYVGFGDLGIGPLDVALWDFAGKYYDAPIHELLGTYRTDLPAYASTSNADASGGLDSPEAYADFAEHCLELGYPAFKIHGWLQSGDAGKLRSIQREVDTVNAVADRVGDEMDLMMDPALAYETFADALKVARACAENDYFWLEDPYNNGGATQNGHRKLREKVDVSLLQGEFLRGLETNTDLIASDATDFARADPDTDAGITGAMKIAHAAEGLGVDVEIHGPGPAQRHCIAAIRNTNYYEMALLHPVADNFNFPPVYDDDYSDELDAIGSDGTVPVPDDPGLGVEYDWDYIEEHTTGHRVLE